MDNIKCTRSLLHILGVHYNQTLNYCFASELHVARKRCLFFCFFSFSLHGIS